MPISTIGPLKRRLLNGLTVDEEVDGAPTQLASGSSATKRMQAIAALSLDGSQPNYGTTATDSNRQAADAARRAVDLRAQAMQGIDDSAPYAPPATPIQQPKIGSLGYAQQVQAPAIRASLQSATLPQTTDAAYADLMARTAPTSGTVNINGLSQDEIDARYKALHNPGSVTLNAANTDSPLAQEHLKEIAAKRQAQEDMADPNLSETDRKAYQDRINLADQRMGDLKVAMGAPAPTFQGGSSQFGASDQTAGASYQGAIRQRDLSERLANDATLLPATREAHRKAAAQAQATIDATTPAQRVAADSDGQVLPVNFILKRMAIEAAKVRADQTGQTQAVSSGSSWGFDQGVVGTGRMIPGQPASPILSGKPMTATERLNDLATPQLGNPWGTPARQQTYTSPSPLMPGTAPIGGFPHMAEEDLPGGKQLWKTASAPARQQIDAAIRRGKWDDARTMAAKYILSIDPADYSDDKDLYGIVTSLQAYVKQGKNPLNVYKAVNDRMDMFVTGKVPQKHVLAARTRQQDTRQAKVDSDKQANVTRVQNQKDYDKKKETFKTLDDQYNSAYRLSMAFETASRNKSFKATPKPEDNVWHVQHPDDPTTMITLTGDQTFDAAKAAAKANAERLFAEKNAAGKELNAAYAELTGKPYVPPAQPGATETAKPTPTAQPQAAPVAAPQPAPKPLTPELVAQLKQQFPNNKDAARQWLINNGYEN
jgi:hypothetical protein